MLNVEFGPRLILGMAGTGKTTLLAQAVLTRSGSVADALMLAPTRTAADALRVRVARRVGDGAVPIVETFYSLAAGVVDEFGVELGYGGVRVLDAAAQDSRVRQVLTLMVKDADVGWPQEFAEALATNSFVRALRQLIARCQIAGVTSEQLAELAHTGPRVWRPAAEFLRRYYDVLDAEGVVDYAGLVTLAAAIASDPRIGQVLQRRFSGIYVDHFEDCDPAHVRLLHAIAAPDRDIWVCADPAQSVDAFRGASGLAVRKFGELFAGERSLDAITTVLTDQYRFGSQIGNVMRIGWTAGRPQGVPPEQLNAYRGATGMAGKPSALAIVACESDAQVGPAVCQQIKQAWIDGQIDSLADVAVIGRTWQGELADVVQELRTQRLPVQLAQDSQPLSRSRSVRAVLDLVDLDPTNPDDIVVRDLLSIGWQVGPVQFRRMQRALRRGGHSWSDILLSDDAFGEVEIAALVTLRSASTRVQQEISQGNLHRAIETAAEALGVHGDSSVRELLALVGRRVSEAADLLDVSTLIADVRKQAVAPAFRQQPAVGVTVTTAHQARGREWKLVVLCDLADGVWPKLTRDCDLLSVGELSRLTGQTEIDDNALANEKRLFSLACSRARDALVLVVPTNEPSRFITRLRRSSDATESCADTQSRELTVAALVARLWQIVDSSQHSPQMREEARARLRQLASEGHRAARPTARWGALEWTQNDRPLRDLAEPVRMSGSSWEAISRCSLRWFLEHEVGARTDSAAAGFGTAVHAVADELATNQEMSDDALRQRLAQLWQFIDFDVDWLAREEMMQAVAAVQRFRHWQTSRLDRTLLATEMPFDRVVDTPAGPVQLVGKIDRLESDTDGRLHIVDLKTKRQPETRAEVAQHRQLALYQLAVDDQEPDAEIAGAELVQLRIGMPDGASPKVQVQEAIDLTSVRERLAEAVEVVKHEQFRPNPSSKNCRTCPLVSVCPAQQTEVLDDDLTLSTATNSD